jgi:predicted CXXCH cytochrome family protein
VRADFVRFRNSKIITFLALGLAAGAACRAKAPPVAVPPPKPLTVTSNVERRDYAGSASCASCHPEIHAKWEAAPMRRMTRAAVGAAIRAPFDGTTIRFKGDRVTVLEREGRRYMKVVSASGEQVFRVTKVVGGRYREDYVGVQVEGTGADDKTVGDPEDEPVLPLSYLLFAKAWRYKGYSVLVRERAHVAKHGAPWRQTCIFCHNTEPHLATLYDDLLGGGRSYQGSVADRLLPAERLWHAEITEPALLARALGDELAFLKAKAADADETTEQLLERTIRATHDRFGEKQLVETGVGCEACHNGAKEHVQDPKKLPTFDLKSAFLRVGPKQSASHGSGEPELGDAGAREPTRAELINHTCARCHTVLFSKYPFTWEGGLRKKHPGGSSINSGEARDFLLGGCTGGMSCVACHDPHGEDRPEDLERLGTTAGNDRCTGCHARYRAPEDRARHTHHAAESAGSACLGCHMPKKNAGLGYRLTRYHRIGSPTDAARVLHDRPLECALCHQDKSVEELASTMERWWHKRYDRRALRDLYGDDLDARPVILALAGKPHEQIVASALLPERGRRDDAARLLPLLSNDYPLVRHWAHDAVERLVGQPMPVDLDGDASAIAAEASAFLEKAVAPHP